MMITVLIFAEQSGRREESVFAFQRITAKMHVSTAQLM